MRAPEFHPLPGTPACSVAESPTWDGGRLFWVDIVGRKIFRHDPASGACDRWSVRDFPTAVALVENSGKAVLALAGGVALFDFETGSAAPFCAPDPVPGNRLNEGKCDPRGRFWVGSMQSNLNPDGGERKMDRSSGALFRIDADGAASRHTDFEFGIFNTMAWSPDGKIFYFGDTVRNALFACDFDLDDGTIRNRRVLLENYPCGGPDGSAMDADGCLWNARFGGGRVVRIAPNGRIDREIPLPVSNPTSCAFGGPSRSRLFVSSATFTLPPEQLAANPLEGRLLAAEVDAVGLPDNRFVLASAGRG